MSQPWKNILWELTQSLPHCNYPRPNILTWSSFAGFPVFIRWTFHGRNDLRLTFDDDSDRDEAEASKGDMKAEPEDKEKKKEDEGAEDSVEAEPTKVQVHQPCILIFDSLASLASLASKARTCQTLR